MEEEVLKLLKECGPDDGRLAEAMEGLSQRGGDEVFQTALRHLTGKEFDRSSARRHWREAVRYLHGSPATIGLRSALLDYLHRIAGEMHDPRILEAGQLEALRHASITDGLTGLYQQAYFKSYLARELADRRRSPGTTLAVLIFDLDHFKQYNDRCGHLAGDRALARVASIIRECTRDGDLVARYGGEEFIVLLQRVSRQQAFKVAERVRAAVERVEFPRQDLLDSGNLTISGGIALFPEDGDTAEGLIVEADRQLYQAKVRRNAISPTHRDRRRTHRQKVRSVLEISGGDGHFEPGITYDVSGFGITLGCGLDLLAGSEIRLRFSEPFWREQREVTARVRHLRQDGESRLVVLGLEVDPAVSLENLLPPGDSPAGHRRELSKNARSSLG